MTGRAITTSTASAVVPGHHAKGKPYRYKHGWIPIIPRINASEARGDSRAVSPEEFDRLADEGRDQLKLMRSRRSPLTRNWDRVIDVSYPRVKESWGGATIDAHTGEALPQKADKYALSIKPPGVTSVSIPETASHDRFAAAMREARGKFANLLRRQGFYLGVFHDDDNQRIDIDPVVVVDSKHDVETIGSYTHAVGGAYHFSDGNGYFPPHVEEPARSAPKILANGTVHWAGPGQWRSAADEVQEGSAVTRASKAGHHIPGTPYKYKHGWIPIAAAPGDEKFKAALESGEALKNRPTVSGIQGESRIVTFNDGSKYFHKKLSGALSPLSARKMADREEAADLVARAVGARAPHVYRTGTEEIYSDFVPGQTAIERFFDEIPSSVYNTPAARRIGLLHILTGDADVNEGNMLFDESLNVTSIDHSMAFVPVPHGGRSNFMETASPFASVVESKDFRAVELDRIQKELVSLQPEFKRIFGGTDEYAQMLRWWKAFRGSQ